MTNKYLSAILKQETGMTALEWIEHYVILYAKSCLNSTTMTIQEISDELDFPSQSVFGKYFKRVEGVSPKNYRVSLLPMLSSCKGVHRSHLPKTIFFSPYIAEGLFRNTS